MMKHFAIIFCMLTGSVNLNAATFNYLESPSLSGILNGPDLLWNTADDFSVIPPGFTGFNPQGGATNFLFNGPVLFGSVVGSFETSGPVQIGVNTLTSLNADVLLNDFSVPAPVLGIQVQETLSSSGTSTITLAANNSASSSMIINTSSIAGNDVFTLTGNYNFLNNGEDPSVIFAGAADVIGQFAYLLPLLPSNWDKLFIGTESFVFASGGTGNQSGIFYTTSEVPLPPAIWLLGSALFGLIGVSRKK